MQQVIDCPLEYVEYDMSKYDWDKTAELGSYEGREIGTLFL